MKITAAPSPRGTNNERLFLFHCPRDGPWSLRVRVKMLGIAFFGSSPAHEQLPPDQIAESVGGAGVDAGAMSTTGRLTKPHGSA